jgi:hypothetical protein
VADTDAAVGKAQELRGQLSFGPQDTPYGRMAVLADPQRCCFRRDHDLGGRVLRPSRLGRVDARVLSVVSAIIERVYEEVTARLAAALRPRRAVPLPGGLLLGGADARLKLARLATEAPSPAVVTGLAELGGELGDEASRLTLLRGWDRVAAWAAAQQQTLIAQIAGPEPPPGRDGSDADDWVREDIACALRLSPGSAYRRVELARRLDGALRRTRDALARGQITFLQALALAERVAGLNDDAARAVQDRVLPGAGTASLGRFRAAVARAVAAVDPDGLAAAHRRAVAERRVERWAGDGGEAVLAATGPAVDVELIFAALSAGAEAAERTARERGYDVPRMGAARFDTLVGWARTALGQPAAGAAREAAESGAGHRAAGDGAGDGTGGDRGTGAAGAGDGIGDGTGAAGDVCVTGAPGATSGTADDAGRGARSGDCGSAAGAARPAISVIIDLPTLLGLADNPGELRGHGPIPAVLARALAADGRWRRLVTDPVTGTALDYGRRSYVPPADLAAFVTARDRTCRFPHCTRPAERCDRDHRRAWDDGGATSAANLASLCRRHHRLKTFGGWRYQPRDDGGIDWSSPTGHRYTTPAATYDTS